MRKHFLLCMFSLLSLPTVQAQDIITKRSGDNFQAKVMEVTPA
ncbi:hypothetical protein [Pontibacter sp. E15-1]|nr:hypothetical protein [Pontibacter sp. E15-1]